MAVTIPDHFPDKIAGEDKKYGVDWQNELGSDTIATNTWSSSPSGLTFSNESTSTPTGGAANQQANAYISGGTANKTYTVINTIVTTTSAETFVARIRLKVARALP